MPATTPHGFPYPLGSDPWSQGGPDIEALATVLDTYHSAAVWAIRSAVQSMPYAVTDVVWTPGVSSFSPEFAFSAGDTVLTYTGPTRWFHYDIRAQWFVASDAGVASQRECYFDLNGALYDQNRIYLDNAAPLPHFPSMNRFGGLVPLATGYTLKLRVWNGTGSGVNRDCSPTLQLVGL